MERKWTKRVLAEILFTDRDSVMLERLIQREMRGGSESVLGPIHFRRKVTVDWTVEPREMLLSEIERLQTVVDDRTHAVCHHPPTFSLHREKTDRRQENRRGNSE